MSRKIRSLDDLLLVPSGGLAEDLLQWLIGIDAFMTPASQTNFGTLSVDTNGVYNGVVVSSGAQNAQISFNVVLAAGTWTLELTHDKAANNGIYTAKLDGNSVGTIDGYGSTTYSVRSQITSISVTGSGKKTLQIIMATRNASSTSYYGRIRHLQLKRTA